MNRSKSLSMFVAVALGTGLVATPPAEAKARNDKPVTVFGQRIDSDFPTQRVSYRDLNLATQAGEKVLLRRVGGAVREVCADVAGRDRLVEGNFCRNFAWDGARPQIARALMRAREIASTGTSAILPVAITLSTGRE